MPRHHPMPPSRTLRITGRQQRRSPSPKSETSVRLVASALGLALMFAAHPSRAQPAEAAALAQFDEGRALMKQKKYAEACAAFETSQKLDPAMGTLYNLAGCHVQIGKLATAWTEYRDLEQRDRDVARAKDSGKRAKALFPRLPKLHLDVSPKPPPPGLVVKLDGADVTVLVGTDAPLDIGAHQIDATAPGYVDVHQSAMLDQEAKTTTIAIELAKPVTDKPVIKAVVKPIAKPVEPITQPPARPAPVPAQPQPQPQPIGIASEGHGHRKLGYALGVTGVVLVGTSLVFGNAANGDWSDAKSLCPNQMCSNPVVLAQGNELVDNANSNALISTVLAGAGVAAIGVGLWLVLTSSDNEAPRAATAWRVAPTVSPTAVGFAIGGSF